MTYDLFETLPQTPSVTQIAHGAVLLSGFAFEQAVQLIQQTQAIIKQAPLRYLKTPGGHRMSVAMTNCGHYGWVSDARGYRYEARDPCSGQLWPAMPETFLKLARQAAQQAGFENYQPDACVINQYDVGARMSLHQDKDEQDQYAPIVSISLGLPAIFLFGGLQRSDRTSRYYLSHGDVVVWGGPSRFRYHGVLPIKPGYHKSLGERRINITFRKVK